MTNLLEKIKKDKIEYEVAEKGIVNTTYITNNYVVQEPEHGSEGKLRKNRIICDILSKNGAPVPKIVEFSEDPMFVVYEKLEGTSLENREEFTEEEYLNAIRSAGEALAKIHRQGVEGYGKPDKEQNFKTAEHENWHSFLEEYIQDSLDYAQSGRFEPIAERAAELIETEILPKRPESKILHMDYTPDNIIIDSDLEAKVVDFDDAYYGDPRFDLAHSALSMSKRGDDVRTAFMDGYQKESDMELKQELMEIYRALAILQNTRAGEWCLRNDKDINFDEWTEGLENFLKTLEK